MFLFISKSKSGNGNISLIQIHLMFLFINATMKNNYNTSYSNTSHVLIYPYRKRCNNVPRFIQIHLMFLFIALYSLLLKLYIAIQIHLMFLFIITEQSFGLCSWDSNTSHVLIYLWLYRRGFIQGKIQIHLMFLFIYVEYSKK